MNNNVKWKSCNHTWVCRPSMLNAVLHISIYMYCGFRCISKVKVIQMWAQCIGWCTFAPVSHCLLIFSQTKDAATKRMLGVVADCFAWIDISLTVTRHGTCRLQTRLNTQNVPSMRYETRAWNSWTKFYLTIFRISGRCASFVIAITDGLSAYRSKYTKCESKSFFFPPRYLLPNTHAPRKLFVFDHK